MLPVVFVTRAPRQSPPEDPQMWTYLLRGVRPEPVFSDPRLHVSSVQGSKEKNASLDFAHFRCLFCPLEYYLKNEQQAFSDVSSIQDLLLDSYALGAEAASTKHSQMTAPRQSPPEDPQMWTYLLRGVRPEPVFSDPRLHEQQAFSDVSSIQDLLLDSYALGAEAASTKHSQMTAAAPPPMCQEHERVMEFFCQTDGTLICSFCVVMGTHKLHDVVAILDQQACPQGVKARNYRLASFVGRKKVWHRSHQLLSDIKKIDGDYTQGLQEELKGVLAKIKEFQAVRKGSFTNSCMLPEDERLEVYAHVRELPARVTKAMTQDEDETENDVRDPVLKRSCLGLFQDWSEVEDDKVATDELEEYLHGKDYSW
ncbi:hypothetical protein HPB47_008125 [Ixodes persulcatus]|uniref:Uncharacterized protein n=1 Tax=Ixodes persulcatus TaxID=34615 RepID=A0AC60P600_IXOPE|nr:hypothetical protein HPB47_008125 [Ixodes persulcatus]